MAITFDSTMSTTDYSLRNRLYSVILRQDQGTYGKDDGIPRFVVGSLPEGFQIDQRVDWNPAWGGGSYLPELAQKILSVMGTRQIAQVGTMQVWQGQGELEFTVEFEFRAWSDPEKDVIQPLRTLLAMTLPLNLDNGFMRSPGGYLPPSAGYEVAKDIVTTGGVGALTSKAVINNAMVHKVSLAIGRWLYFDNIVITGVQHTINGQTPFRGLSDNYLVGGGVSGKWAGLPQSAKVVVSFKPTFMMTENDLEFMLGNSSYGQQTITSGANSVFEFNDDQMELIDLYDPLAT